MSVWRLKAIDIAPELKNDLQDPDVSIYLVFSSLRSLLAEAYANNDVARIQKIYDYAEWCSKQKATDLWNAAGVSFYEHLADDEGVFSQFTTWIKKDIYFAHRDLLNQRFGDD